ncbi:amino acid ABC transporter permease [Nocardioides sp. AN3]
MEALRTVMLGLPMTLVVTAGALLIGTVLAVPLTLGLEHRRGPVWFLCRAAVDLVRGVPPVVWLFILFYGISLGTVRLSALSAGIGALGLVASAYLAEIFRGSLKSIHFGQAEAATALGLSLRATWVHVIGPQAWRTALPAYTNYAIALLKDSSIVSIVGVAEIVSRSGQLSRTSDLGIFVFVLAGGVYVLLSILLAWGSRHLHHRLHEAVAV